jgi:hypothetical protein
MVGLQESQTHLLNEDMKTILENITNNWKKLFGLMVILPVQLVKPHQIQSENIF